MAADVVYRLQVAGGQTVYNQVLKTKVVRLFLLAGGQRNGLELNRLQLSREKKIPRNNQVRGSADL